MRERGGDCNGDEVCVFVLFFRLFFRCKIKIMGRREREREEEMMKRESMQEKEEKEILRGNETHKKCMHDA